MGQVVPFIARVRDSGDWSATERARLQDLADRLAAGGVDVEVIFGATDEGDPWCVVTDGNGDVLIHVARIDGVFVVHSAVDDAVNENVDLHTALRDRLAATEEAIAPESATILPFGLTARQGQTFLALVVATAFFYETSGVAGTAEAAELPQDLPPPEPSAPAQDADAPTQERELATQGATQHQQPMSAPMAVAAAAVQAPEPATPAARVEDARAAAPAATLETPAPASATTADAVLTAAKAEADTVIQGTAGDDLLVGTTADEHILGGDGADTLRGGGGADLLEGGAGDDVIELATGVVAVGGEGADTFVIQAPTRLGAGETLLGVVIDFSGFEGDRVTLANGRAIEFWRPPTKDEGEGGETGPTTGGGNDFTGQGVDPTGPTGPTLQPGPGDFGPTLVGPPLTRVDVDVDGDGVMDGYILVGARGHVLGGEDNPIVIARPPGGDDLFG